MGGGGALRWFSLSCVRLGYMGFGLKVSGTWLRLWHLGFREWVQDLVSVKH